MPPRKSVSRSSRRSSAKGGEADRDRTEDAAAVGSAVPVSIPKAEPSSVATSSKVTLDMPPAVADSITYDYESAPIAPQVFTENDKERLVHEIMGFSPFNILHDISEHARGLIYPTIASVDEWARKMAEDDDAMEHEIELGSHALETLLENHVDRAFDTFTAYALRNTFRVPDGVELVLPWQEGTDFARAKFVTSLSDHPSDGEAVLLSRLSTLRTQVEQARLVRHQLAMAEAALDRKLEMAARRRAQVGFVHDGIADAGLTPLPDQVDSITRSMTGIHEQVTGLEVPVPRSVDPSRDKDSAWEAGRQAYLSWAVGRALAQDDASLDSIVRDTKSLGSAEEIAALAKIVK